MSNITFKKSVIYIICVLFCCCINVLAQDKISDATSDRPFMLYTQGKYVFMSSGAATAYQDRIRKPECQSGGMPVLFFSAAGNTYNNKQKKSTQFVYYEPKSNAQGSYWVPQYIQWNTNAQRFRYYAYCYYPEKQTS